jgi:hypothetical protein
MNVRVVSYVEQVKRWPDCGRHILAQYDEETILVYQAYRSSIGRFAVKHGHFGGDFKYSRMSWIKPNFLWMMYRSDWGTAEGQEVVLALRLRRSFFDLLLAQAVPSGTVREQGSLATRCRAIRRAPAMGPRPPADRRTMSASCASNRHARPSFGKLR